MQGDAVVFRLGLAAASLKRTSNHVRSRHRRTGASATPQNEARGTSRRSLEEHSPRVWRSKQAAASNQKRAATMLPRLDFHSLLRDAVLNGSKTATTRLVGELDQLTPTASGPE